MCGGTRFSCKAIFNEPNQYGKGVFRPGKTMKNSYMDEYDDYVASLYDDDS